MTCIIQMQLVCVATVGMANSLAIVNRLKILQGLSTLLFRRGVEFPRGEGSSVIHRKNKDVPALQRCHLIYNCLGQSLWLGEFTCDCKQVVKRLKIPHGRLSTLLFRRWSEVPSRGGVRGYSS